jgi:hypothetical protein
MNAPGTQDPAQGGPALAADPADVVEQQRPLVEEEPAGTDAAEGLDPSDLLEADPADRLDQLREVPVDDDYDR